MTEVLTTKLCQKKTMLFSDMKWFHVAEHQKSRKARISVNFINTDIFIWCSKGVTVFTTMNNILALNFCGMHMLFRCLFKNAHLNGPFKITHIKSEQTSIEFIGLFLNLCTVQKAQMENQDHKPSNLAFSPW